MDVQSRKVSTSNKQRGRLPPSFWEEVHHPKLMRIPFWSWDAIKKTCVETFHHGIREISSWWKGSPSRSFLHESKLFASTSWTPLPQLDTSGFRIGEKDSVSFRSKNLLHVPRTGVQPFHWCDKGWNDITLRLSSHSYSCTVRRLFQVTWTYCRILCSFPTFKSPALPEQSSASTFGGREGAASKGQQGRTAVISAARQEVMETSLELTASVMPAWVNRGHFSGINASSAMALSLNVMSAAAAACCNIPEDMEIAEALDLYASLFK